MNLDRGTFLQREPELRIVLRPSGDLEIERAGDLFHAGARGLSVLEVFSRPLALEDALQRLLPADAGRVEGLETVETIFGMLNAGVLRRVGEEALPLRARPDGSDAVQSHILLLNDGPRTSGFLSAVEEVVRPGDVVAEVGTGTGVLSVGAARAGARRVYAIESGAIALQANRLFETSGYSDRISLIREPSFSAALPELADVLVTETIGDDPLDERIVDVVADARRRLLKEGARVVPALLSVYAQAFRIPDGDLGPLTFGPESIAAWGEAYGIDFEPVRQVTDATLRRRWVSPRHARDWQAVSDAVRLFEIDFAAPLDLPPEVAVDLPSAGPRPDGMLVFFEARLSPSVSLSTRPSVVGPDNSWRSPLWLFPAVAPLPERLRFRLEARRRIRLDWPVEPAL